MRICLGVGNEYGTCDVYEENEKYFISCDGATMYSEQEISKEFFDACVKEFGHKQDEFKLL